MNGRTIGKKETKRERERESLCEGIESKKRLVKILTQLKRPSWKALQDVIQFVAG